MLTPESELQAKPAYDYPLYVRVFAGWHVLSILLGPVGFLVLGVVAGLRWIMHGFDGWVVGFSIAGITWLLANIAFRHWFVRFGRRNWPEPEEPVVTLPAGERELRSVE